MVRGIVISWNRILQEPNEGLPSADGVLPDKIQDEGDAPIQLWSRGRTSLCCLQGVGSNDSGIQGMEKPGDGDSEHGGVFNNV